MSDTFPELELALPEAQLEALGALAASGAGEKLVNTLCLAAACGNAPLARFVLAECAPGPWPPPSLPHLLRGSWRRYGPSLRAEEGPLALLNDVIATVLGQQNEPEPEPEPEPEEEQDEDLVETIDVSVPDGAASGEALVLVLEDGREMQVAIPEGLQPGDQFQARSPRPASQGYHRSWFLIVLGCGRCG